MQKQEQIKAERQFYIITSFQLLNAIEFIFHEKKDDLRNVLILCTTSASVLDDAKKVQDLYPWAEIKILFPKWMLTIRPVFLKTILTTVWARIRLSLWFNKKATLVFGNQTNIFCKFISKKVPQSQQVLLDDGAGSIIFGHETPYSQLSASLKFTYRVLGIKDAAIRPAVFFTTFADTLKKKELPEMRLIENKYGYLRSLISNKKKTDAVYFVGGPIVEIGMISEEEYTRQVAGVKRKFPGALYIPHRLEDPAKLSRIAGLIPLHRPGMPLELFLVKSENLPFALIGHFSSALFAVHKIYDDAIKLYHIRLKRYGNLELKGDLYDKVYDELALISDRWNDDRDAED